MSGSGGGNGGSGPVTPDDTVNCAMLFDKTVVNSPDPKVIKKLKVGEKLHVTVDPKRVVKVVTAAGDIAGSITSIRMLQFIDCIEKGFSYVAIVRAINGGRCEVEIRPESK